MNHPSRALSHTVCTPLRRLPVALAVASLAACSSTPLGTGPRTGGAPIESRVATPVAVGPVVVAPSPPARTVPPPLYDGMGPRTLPAPALPPGGAQTSAIRPGGLEALPIEADAAPSALPSAAASAPVAPVGPALPYSAAVAARFPDPAVRYDTPAFEPGRTTFTSNAEVQSILRSLVREGGSGAPTVRLLNVGSSQSGQPIEGLLYTRSNDSTASGVVADGKPTVLFIGQQHGDEPAGSEALLALARQLASGPQRRLIDQINVIIVPRANVDGADRRSRVTGNGIDINRDHLLLRTPEARALARLSRDFKPMVVVDAHEYTVVGRFLEKFGTIQRYDALLQYAMAGNVPEFVSKAAEQWYREPLQAAFKRADLTSDWYYTTSTDPSDKRISMGGTQPDTGRNVNGLKNAVSLLIETRGVGIGRLHLQRRVHTHVIAANTVLESTARHASDLNKLRQFVETDVSAKACKGTVIVDAGPTPSEYTLQMLDPVSGADRAVAVSWNSALALIPKKTRTRPCGYWLAADQVDAVTRLRDLGVKVEQMAAFGELRGESYRELSRETAQRQDVRGAISEGRGIERVEVGLAPASIDADAGSYYVSLAQPLANLVVAALEPDTQNSYFANGLVDRLPAIARVTTLPAARLFIDAQ